MKYIMSLPVCVVCCVVSALVMLVEGAAAVEMPTHSEYATVVKIVDPGVNSGESFSIQLKTDSGLEVSSSSKLAIYNHITTGNRHFFCKITKSLTALCVVPGTAHRP